MPREIFDEEKFLELSEFAVHCRVKRVKDIVKLEETLNFLNQNDAYFKGYKNSSRKL